MHAPSVIILIYDLFLFLALGTPRQESDFFPVGESGFPDWMFLFRGVKLFHFHLAEGAVNGELAPLLHDGSRRWNEAYASILSDDAPVKIHLHHLRYLIKQTPTVDTEDEKIYLDAITGLEGAFAAYVRPDSRELLGNGDTRLAFVWLFSVTDSLLPLLKTGKQEASVLLAFFAVLLHRTPQHHWWMQSWPEHLIAKIYKLLDEEHRLWIRWPIEEMGWVPPS